MVFKTDANVFCSWSGGKDSCLALHRAVQAGARPQALVTMMVEDGHRSRSHGLRQDVVNAQAEAMQLPVIMRSTSWSAYEETFSDVLNALRNQGISVGIFGDIDLQDHRDWVERVSAGAGMEAVLPLWLNNRLSVVRECIDLGIDCRIVSCKSDLMGESYLGMKLTRELAESLQEKGIDACGENGEFHTVVVDAPMFNNSIVLESVGAYEHGGYWALDYQVALAKSSA